MTILARLLSGFRFQVSGFAFVVAAATTSAGWSFDTNLSPEKARDLLAAPGFPAPPPGSWLRLREVERSMIHDDTGAEVPAWMAIKPPASLAERRDALTALRERGYRLIAFVRWPSRSWADGVRSGQPTQRLPLDLREATTRCRQLAEAYGDLIDYWEIENEPDISFVDENPETYAAFLKACYLGFTAKVTAGKREEVGGKRSEGDDSGRLPLAASPLPQTARVLAAAFALPPGPYFDAWVANDGLRYTDGFNYHYYGYAEDSTGVYRQFEEAVTRARTPTPADTAVFQTRFYPHDAGLKPRVVASFAFGENETRAQRTALEARPLAGAEPALEPQGRWLVSPGTSVRETSEGWEFIVTSPAPGPLRPAMAELPLPAGWSLPQAASLAFEYRAVRDTRPETGDRRPEAVPILQPPAPVTEPAAHASRPQIVYPAGESALSGLRSQVSGLPAAGARQLPVFLTEYGYGLLGKEARQTVAGREAQRAWFAAVQPQLEALGIDAAMAFVLMPYLEQDLNECGLLMSADSGPRRTEDGGGQTTEDGGRRMADGGTADTLTSSPLPLPAAYAASPALLALLEAGKKQIVPRDWSVVTTAPSPVVIDFVAGSALKMSKTRRGYLLQADTAKGSLVLYNLGAEPVSGELSLEGSAWALPGGERQATLRLAPGARREISVKIDLGNAARFDAHVAGAKFVIAPQGTMESGKGEAASAVLPEPARRDAGPPVGPKLPVSGLRSQVSPFEVYLRTSNGNLYQTWPRLRAGADWQWYVETLASFTPAFFGRAYLPSALQDNEPVALVFFFRPKQYPVTYHVRHASVVEFEARQTAPVSGKR